MLLLRHTEVYALIKNIAECGFCSSQSEICKKSLRVFVVNPSLRHDLSSEPVI